MKNQFACASQFFLKYLAAAVFGAAFLLLASCNSVPKNIPVGMSVAELTQAAQSAYDTGNVVAANAYYQTIIERFGDDPAARIPAEYEIAHILVKKRNWHEARPMLEKIISDFSKASLSSRLPREYLKLAQIDMEKIPQ
ncbi:MAG: lipoprotein [Treponemataceae bacterium]|nr:MAG: lipoprotein [Treponemataceae bacterium]